MKNEDYKRVSADELDKLFKSLQNRFEKNMHRHINLNWGIVQEKLEKENNKLPSLNQMELTGGEPDVINYDQNTKVITFCDCSPESPAGRRSLCYDTEALLQRKENKPKNSAIEMASTMGIEILDEFQYFELQKLGKFDTKTSSWLKTPSAIRILGGAIFGDYRYGRVFVYHNGAESYYAARGFRGILKV